MKTWLIYCYTNIINNYKYIRQTCTTIKHRAHTDGSGYCSGYQPCFEQAIKEFGWNNFKLDILESDIMNIDTANAREIYWIAYYHTYIYNSECAGYNMTPGGYARGEVSERTRKLISAHAKTYIGEKNPFYGRHHTEESKKLIGQKSLGRQTFLGKKHSKESIEKMRISQLGIKPTNSKKCKCVNDNKIFASYADAGAYYKISSSSVGNSIKYNKVLRCGLKFIQID